MMACAHLAPEKTAQLVREGKPHVIRMRVPTEGTCQVQDMLRGTVEIPWTQVDMQVLLKTRYANVSFGQRRR